MTLLKKIIKGVKFRLESHFLRCVAVFDYLKSNNNIYNKPSMCAFYQCYKRPKCVIATLTSFRKIYLDGTVHLFCDQGDDMSHIASHFNCRYEYITNRTGNGTTLYFLSKERLIPYVKRLLFAAQNSKEDFLMILEDDTILHNKIRKLKFDWNCIKSNHHYSGGGVTSLLKTRNNSIPSYIRNMYFAGWGGVVLNRTFFVEHFSNEKELLVAIDLLSPYIQGQWNGALPMDAILTALILYFGGTVGWYPGFSEVQYWRYKFKPFLGRIDVVHNDKSLYNAPLSKWENKIFQGN